MPVEQLKSIAESMGIKKFDNNEPDDLIYKILDQQAIDMAQAQAATPAAPKKRGRKKKEAKNDAPAAADKPEDSSAQQQKPDMPLCILFHICRIFADNTQQKS